MAKEFICNRTCLVKGNRVETNDVIKIKDKDIILCPECDGSGKKDDKVCPYCKGTKRIYPPHHFTEVDSDGDPIEVEEVEDNSDEERKEELRAELKSMHKDYDGRWGVEKLEYEVMKAKKETGA